MEYTIYYWVHLGYDVDVIADSQEDAIEKAEEIIENIPLDDWSCGDSGVEIID